MVLAIIVWVTMIPIFEHNAGRFGWGFFPLLITIFILPLFSLGLFFDGAINVAKASGRHENRTARRVAASVSIGVFVYTLAGWVLILR